MRRWALVTATAATVLIALAVIVRALPEIAPESDFAIIDLQILGVLKDFQPLGAYSRFDWSHPGPFYFQLLAPLYWLSGFRHLSVLVGAATINVACIALLLTIVRVRSGSAALVLAVLTLLGVFLARAWDLLASVWNPHVPILPLSVLIAAGAAAISRPWPWLPVSVALGSLVAQSHLGFALVVASVLAVALVGAAWSSRRGVASPVTSQFRRSLVVAAIVGGAIWLLPLADELRPDGQHNLRRIAAFFGDAEPMAAREANRLFARYYVAPFAGDLSLPWGAPLQPVRDELAQTLASVEFGLLLIVAAMWWRRGGSFEARVALVTAGASAAAFVSVQQLASQPNDQGVFWISILGVLSWSSILALPLDVIVRRFNVLRPSTTSRLVAVAIAAAVVVAVLQIRDRIRDPVHASNRVPAWTDMVERELRTNASPLVDVPQPLLAPVAGVVLQLDRRGWQPRVNADRVRMFGRRFAPDGTETPVFRFAEPALHSADFQYRSNYRVIGRTPDVVAYVEEPPSPATAVVPEGPILMSGTPGRPGTSGTPGARLTLPGPDHGITFSTSGREVVGLRVRGQAGTSWSVFCARPEFPDGAKAGLISLADGAEPAVGEAYLRLALV